jgi:hypothetical protein
LLMPLPWLAVTGESRFILQVSVKAYIAEEQLQFVRPIAAIRCDGLSPIYIYVLFRLPSWTPSPTFLMDIASGETEAHGNTTHSHLAEMLERYGSSVMPGLTIPKVTRVYALSLNRLIVQGT